MQISSFLFSSLFLVADRVRTGEIITWSSVYPITSLGQWIRKTSSRLRLLLRGFGDVLRPSRSHRNCITYIRAGQERVVAGVYRKSVKAALGCSIERPAPSPAQHERRQREAGSLAVVVVTCRQTQKYVAHPRPLRLPIDFQPEMPYTESSLLRTL